MARVAIVSYDVQTIQGKAGGVAALTTRWAELLRSAGEEVTIVMTRTDWEPMSVDPQWKARYKASGINLIELQSPRPSANRWPEVPTMRVSEMAAPVLRNFDIVYFQDWGNVAFHLVRERRYTIDQGPVCVTGVHGPSEWEQSSNGKLPEIPGGLHLAFQERYAAEHSDFVMSSGTYMVNRLTAFGWKFPGPVPLVGLPMPPGFRAGAARPMGTIRSIVYFGRIEVRKGIRIFVEAMQHFASEMADRPEVVLFGSVMEQTLLNDALTTLRSAGFAAIHKMSVDSESSCAYLQENAPHILCVVPSPSDNHPYTIVEASLIPGLNLIACNSGGVPEMLSHAEGQLSAPAGHDLGAKIVERFRRPLSDSELAHYDWSDANQRWLAFHRMALASRASRIVRTLPTLPATVDVIVTSTRGARHLDQLIEALEHQTERNFHVIAGGVQPLDEAGDGQFAELAERVRPHGWDLYEEDNGAGAVGRGTGEFLLFVDADDVLAPHAVGRMREALTLSGDDALVCASSLFASDTRPCDSETGESTAPPLATNIPLGMGLVGGLLEPTAFGGSMFIIRRRVYEAAGGAGKSPGSANEHWGLYVRLTLAGYKVDVLPELLHFRRLPDAAQGQAAGTQAAGQRLLEVYEERLTAGGLTGGALALAALQRSKLELQGKIEVLTARADASGGGHVAGATVRSVFAEKLRRWYRSAFTLATREKVHRVLFARFVGPSERRQ